MKRKGTMKERVYVLSSLPYSFSSFFFLALCHYGEGRESTNKTVGEERGEWNARLTSVLSLV